MIEINMKYLLIILIVNLLLCTKVYAQTKDEISAFFRNIDAGETLRYEYFNKFLNFKDSVHYGLKYIVEGEYYSPVNDSISIICYVRTTGLSYQLYFAGFLKNKIRSNIELYESRDEGDLVEDIDFLEYEYEIINSLLELRKITQKDTSYFHYNVNNKGDILKLNKDNLIGRDFYYISNRFIKSEELLNISASTLKLMRNEVFASYGYDFKSKDLKEYFSQFSWYKPHLKNVDTYLTELEKINIQMIQSVENNN